MSIEREPMRIQYGVIIHLCRRDLRLNRPPTAGELVEWSVNGKGHGLIELTHDQASHLLNNPNKWFEPSPLTEPFQEH